MSKQLDTRRIVIFLVFAFGIAWLTGLIIYLTGGLANKTEVLPGIPLPLVLLAGPYMFAPALANVLTRLVTREGWGGAFLRPRLRHGWPYWIAAWVLPAVLTILGAALFFILFSQYFDPSLTVLRNALAASGQSIPISPWTLVIIQIIAAVLISPIVNGLFTFGEEFGWRAYLLEKLLPLGGRRAVFILGIIWGIWHWPVIVMGYEYGFNYPFFPWLGLLLFPVFTISAGALLAWAALRGASVWPAVIGHAAINGIAAISAFFVRGQPSSLLGPLPVGIIGMAGYILFALWLFIRPGSFEPPMETEPKQAQPSTPEPTGVPAQTS